MFLRVQFVMDDVATAIKRWQFYDYKYWNTKISWYKSFLTRLLRLWLVGGVCQRRILRRTRINSNTIATLSLLRLPMCVCVCFQSAFIVLHAKKEICKRWNVNGKCTYLKTVHVNRIIKRLRLWECANPSSNLFHDLRNRHILSNQRVFYSLRDKNNTIRHNTIHITIYFSYCGKINFTDTRVFLNYDKFNI